MKVLTKDQAQAWLNQPEQEGIEFIFCKGSSELAILAFPNGYTTRAWFAVDFVGPINRKKPWHWPKPDENTPVDAKVWCRASMQSTWIKLFYNRNGYVFDGGRNSWTSLGYNYPWTYIVLANPDDLDEMPPQGLEV